MVSKSEIDFILEIQTEIDRFDDSDFWMSPEEQHRLRALGCKQKADLCDSISMYVLQGRPIEYELRKLIELKEKQNA